MGKELPYFWVDHDYGWNQERFRDPWMKLGGCGAVTACDCSVYFDLYMGTKLCPFAAEPGAGVARIAGADYVRFSKLMKSYLRPRYSGINTLEIYIDGYAAFLREHGERRLRMRGLAGGESLSRARAALEEQIELGFPVPCLNLKHRDPQFSDFVWHWFLLTGVRRKRERLFVKVVSYGQWRWFDFDALWQTGYEEKGGLVLFSWQG